MAKGLPLAVSTTSSSSSWRREWHWIEDDRVIQSPYQGRCPASAVMIAVLVLAGGHRLGLPRFKLTNRAASRERHGPYL